MPDTSVCCNCGKQETNSDCPICSTYTGLVESIDKATVSTKDFNIMFEALAKSADERIYRRHRMPNAAPREMSPIGQVVPKKAGNNNPNQHRGKRNFHGHHKEQLDQAQRDRMAEETGVGEVRRLWIYECPYCGGDAYNGEPGTGTTFRGSAKCSACHKGFPAVKRTPKSKEGPIIGTAYGEDVNNFIRDFANKNLTECAPAIAVFEHKDQLKSALSNILLQDGTRAIYERYAKAGISSDWIYGTIQIIDVHLRKSTHG